MARPREFDEAGVLELALEHFWEHGYEAASMRDLSAAMGMTAASIYNAFGDKRTLYRKALDFYVDRSFGERVGRFEGKLPPLEAIKAFFHEIIERSLVDQKRKGCMLINCSLEVAPHDSDFQRVVGNVLKQVEDFFGRCVVAGQADGSINREHSVDDLARMLLGMLVGIRVLVRTRPERALLEGLVRPSFSLLQPAQPSRTV